MKIRKEATSQERRWRSRQCTTHYAFLTSLWEASRLIPHQDRPLLNHASSIRTQLVLLFLLLLLRLLLSKCVRLFQAEADVTYSFFFFFMLFYFFPVISYLNEKAVLRLTIGSCENPLRDFQGRSVDRIAERTAPRLRAFAQDALFSEDLSYCSNARRVELWKINFSK